MGRRRRGAYPRHRCLFCHLTAWHHLRGGETWGRTLRGCIEVSLRDDAEGCQTSPVAYIEGWYVDENIRRRTLGTRLVQAAEAWARRHGLQEMASDTQIENAVSIQAHQV